MRLILGDSVHTFSTMRIISRIELFTARIRQWRAKGLRIALVPTMGYLHEGHISLVEHARKEVGPRGKVVLSIYVNPTQFAPTEDYSNYPRDLTRDAALCLKAGVDVIFAPADQEMYPAGYSTYVVEETLSRVLEAQSRPAHFRGVTTVVTKLLNLSQPHVAIFGAKDYQQAAIICRMVKDLNLPVEIIVAPTVRESDGVAMSSRNKYLEGDLRRQARVLSQAIRETKSALRKSPRLRAAVLKLRLKRLIEHEPDARVDYIEFIDPESLVPRGTVTSGCHMVLAVFVGATRLIDNARL